MQYWKMLGAALAATVSQTTLAANFNAEIKISGLSYNVTDLDLNDGVDAAVTLQEPLSVTQTYNYLFSEKSNKTYFDRNIVDGIFTPFDAGNLKPSASTRSTALWRGEQLDITTRASARVDAADRGGFEIFFYKSFNFQMAPHTQMVWTADYEMSTSVDRSSPGELGWYSNAYLSYADSSGPNGISVTSYMDPLRGAASDGSAGRLIITIFNDRDEYINNYLPLSLSLQGGAVLSVPEPESYALMVCGVGVLGVWTRKRRQATAAKPADGEIAGA